MDIRNLPRYSYVDDREPRNLGDRLGPMLLERMLGPSACNVAADRARLISIGSVLKFAYRPGDFVWGTGLISSDQQVTITDPDRILALRGPRTFRRLSGPLPSSGVYGDPALLFPLYWPTRTRARKYIGLLPHWIDRPALARQGFHPAAASMINIDITQPLCEIIDALSECHTVISTSLHGIVLAEAYRVPTVIWQDSWSGEVTGGRFKFHDYLEGTGRHLAEPGLLPPLDDYELTQIQRRLTLTLMSALG